MQAKTFKFKMLRLQKELTQERSYIAPMSPA